MNLITDKLLSHLNHMCNTALHNSALHELYYSSTAQLTTVHHVSTAHHSAAHQSAVYHSGVHQNTVHHNTSQIHIRCSNTTHSEVSHPVCVVDVQPYHVYGVVQLLEHALHSCHVLLILVVPPERRGEQSREEEREGTKE